MLASHESGTEDIVILPLTIVTQEFPARPSSLPDVRDFVRRQLTARPLSDDEIRNLSDRVAEVLFEAAGASGAIQVSLRMFPDWTEVDVLQSPIGALAGNRDRGGADAAEIAEPSRARVRPDRGGFEETPPPARPVIADDTPAAEVITVDPPAASAVPQSFAEWLSAGLRREGMTMEAAARRLNVSAKTIGRWAGGTTEPRLRDLYRIREVFGEPPFH
jgi:hypothetical protein